MESEDESFYNSDDYSDEIDNYDSPDDIDEDSDGGADGLKEKNFIILKEGDIHRRLEADVVNICSVLGVSRGAALILLRYYYWRVNDANDEWFADEERVRKAVGLLENPIVDTSGSKEFYCKICLDQLPIDKSNSVSCGHLFCNECWRGYIMTSIYDGPGCLMLKCPEPSCAAAVGQDRVDMLVSEEEKGKYLSYLVRSYVEENKKIKWCPARGCDCAVEFVFGSENYDVTCSCSYSFCWNCTEEAHRPVDCETVLKWVKNTSVSENMNWILVNTKPCPNCKRPIEKNQGCMHMTCKLCKHEFCWLCCESWSIHGDQTGGFYACNHYEEQKQEGKLNEAENIRELAKKSLDRYTHYYERWASNQNAMRKAKEGLKQMQDVDLDVLRLQRAQPLSQMVFILEAWKQIIECRRVLRWTYAYGYYQPEEEKIKKRLFEYLQGEAEAALEKLHHCTEKEILSFYREESSPRMSFEEFRVKLLDLTTVAKNYFENLVRAFENGLVDVVPITLEGDICTDLNVSTATALEECN